MKYVLSKDRQTSINGSNERDSKMYKYLAPLTREQIANMTDEEIIAELAKRGIKGPGGSDIKARTTCPHCGHEGPVEKDFGIRVLRGVAVPQSWCRTCRANPSNRGTKKTSQ